MFYVQAMCCTPLSLPAQYIKLKYEFISIKLSCQIGVVAIVIYFRVGSMCLILTSAEIFFQLVKIQNKFEIQILYIHKTAVYVDDI